MSSEVCIIARYKLGGSAVVAALSSGQNHSETAQCYQHRAAQSLENNDASFSERKYSKADRESSSFLDPFLALLEA